jgi:rfaE bifunctional protein nucleotidyltransferase chain/domain
VREAAAKVAPLEAVRERVEAARRDGRTVALANGCFDVLHVGHVRYLAGAKAEADVLVVGVNDDASVRRLKGEGRPVLPAEDRALLVAALRAVDHVVVFGEDDVGRLLLARRPAVLLAPTTRRNGAGTWSSSQQPGGDRRRPEGPRHPEAPREDPRVKALLVRLSSIGDVVHTLPALAAFHRHGWEADWLVEPPSRILLDGNPLLAQVVVAPSRKGFGWGKALSTVRTLRAQRHDVALDFQGLWKSAAWARLSGARRVVGWERDSRREPASVLLIGERVERRGGGHVIDKNLALLRPLGIEAVGLREFPSALRGGGRARGRLSRGPRQAGAVLKPRRRLGEQAVAGRAIRRAGEVFAPSACARW